MRLTDNPALALADLPLWLQVVSRLYKPSSLTLVGAGNGTGPLVQWLDKQPIDNVLVFEAEASLLSQLPQRLGPRSTWQLRHDLVVPQAQAGQGCTFNRYALASESGLLPLESLRSLWPNLQPMSPQTWPGIPLHTQPSAEWLLLDCLPAAALLDGLPLRDTDVVLARATLNEGDSQSTPTGSGLDEVAALLTPQGFTLLGQFEERNGALGKALFVRDPAGLQEELACAIKSCELLSRRVETEAQDHKQIRQGQERTIQQLHAQLASTRMQHTTQAREQQKKLDDLGTTQAKLEAELARSLQERDHATKQLETARATENHLMIQHQMLLEELTKAEPYISLIKDLFKAQTDDLIKVREHLERVMKKELLNATKQLEAFLNVQSALSGGDLIPGLHGWPISPDLAAYLIELIRTNDYDMVIEFGSGTSTVVMAKALAQMRHRREGKGPVVQMAFEHLEAYHAQTQAQLRAAGLATAATVHLAPLAPYQAANGKTYPYYTCQPALQALQATYDKPNCRALVLVDGPPASTGEHARFPAVSVVTSVLRHVGLDILLDDLIREDEQQVARMWQDDLQAAGREAVAEVRKMEKDACLIRVHPQLAAK